MLRKLWARGHVRVGSEGALGRSKLTSDRTRGSSGPLWDETFGGDRATATLRNICCVKIRGCSYGEAVSSYNVRYAPDQTNPASKSIPPGPPFKPLPGRGTAPLVF